MAKLGFVILGQTPRRDIEQAYRHYLPDTEFLFAGGLDGMSHEEIEQLAQPPAQYPLLTILADGSTREICLYQLLPKLNQKAQELRQQGAQVLVLMCAGRFPDLDIDVPVIYPQRLISAVVGSISAKKRIHIISPNQAQLPVALESWRSEGFTVDGASASPLKRDEFSLAVKEVSERSTADCLVLDCMGFSAESVTLAQPLTSVPVICPQRLVARVVAELLNA
ncbi:AroM family protein [Vibrio nitrifigilis]|uniref:AroM family protein n=1 Tax=Vibrio nitrifigilis TaxID=2789781 RepID=A0ABS0GIF1_9VIBR|nr:AroM family protein [Vibrio nitrifigilis]MBF9002179.1 AroM family protein [Vibrio nitrifigilis]